MKNIIFICIFMTLSFYSACFTTLFILPKKKRARRTLREILRNTKGRKTPSTSYFVSQILAMNSINFNWIFCTRKIRPGGVKSTSIFIPYQTNWIFHTKVTARMMLEIWFRVFTFLVIWHNIFFLLLLPPHSALSHSLSSPKNTFYTFLFNISLVIVKSFAVITS